MAELSQQHKKININKNLDRYLPVPLRKRLTRNFETEEYVLFGQSAD